MKTIPSNPQLFTIFIVTILLLTPNVKLADTAYANDSPLDVLQIVRVFQDKYSENSRWGYQPSNSLHKRINDLSKNTGSVLIYVHGINTDSTIKDIEAYSLAAKCGLKAYLSFEYRENLYIGAYLQTLNPFSDDWPLDNTKDIYAAEELLLTISSVYSTTGAPPVVIAHSHASWILVQMAILKEGLDEVDDLNIKECEQIWKKIPGFMGIWKKLSTKDQNKLLSMRATIRQIDMTAITGCPAVRYNHPGWNSLNKITKGHTWNFYSIKDWLIKLLNFKPLGDQNPGFIPALEYNIGLNEDHGNFFLNEYVQQSVADIVKHGKITEETFNLLVDYYKVDRNDITNRPILPPPDDHGGGGGGARIIMPVLIDGSLAYDEESDQFLEMVNVEIHSTTMAVNIVVINNNPFSITFMPVIGSSFSPRQSDSQGLMIFPGGPVILAINGEKTDQGNGYLFTVPPKGTTEVTLNVVCVTLFKPFPEEGYGDFAMENRGESSLFTQDQNEMLLSILDAVDFIEYRVAKGELQANEPYYSTWLSISSRKEVMPEAIQWAVWAVTDNVTYHYLKYYEQISVEMDVDAQLLADQANLILELAGLTDLGRYFAPPWDINWDFVIDNSDYELVRLHLNENADNNTNPDVNRDGKIDESDLNLVSSHLGETYAPQSLPPINPRNIIWGALSASPLLYISYSLTFADKVGIKTMLSILIAIAALAIAIFVIFHLRITGKEKASMPSEQRRRTSTKITFITATLLTLIGFRLVISMKGLSDPLYFLDSILYLIMFIGTLYKAKFGSFLALGYHVTCLIINISLVLGPFFSLDYYTWLLFIFYQDVHLITGSFIMNMLIIGFALVEYKTLRTKSIFGNMRRSSNSSGLCGLGA